MIDRNEVKERFGEALKLLGSETEIVFPGKTEIEALHDYLIAEFGGVHGIRDPGILESAIHAPMHQAAYQDEISIPRLAAVLASRIVQNHPFMDGNKRTGFLSMVAMLSVNNMQFVADQAAIVSMFQDLAANKVDEEVFARWVERNSCVKQHNTSRQKTNGGLRL